MKILSCFPRGSRRTFLKNLGGVLMATTVPGRLAAVERSRAAPVATAAANSASPAPAPTTMDCDDWNELSDPGWSG